ncbi:hypothetical protein KGB56_25860 (plasmid) [Pseudovibrio brasiliensis]|uniref:Glycosaminoglycan attachment site n=2 Tax=Pseudovibrio brasiliensis TaxID=1898042 RepID=A0ABX8AZM3_9HYPH|nr:hypothetical protein KGB56_25860 [Pseudovibrio brasiliensis]
MGTRNSRVPYFTEEVSWWSSHDEALLGMVSLDKVDGDYSWMILARDRIGRFRCAYPNVSIKDQAHAEKMLRVEMAKVITEGEIEKFGEQGDETNSPLNLFEVSTGQDPEKLHPYFKLLMEEKGREPARKVLQELALWLAPSDPHLVREFQTAGFDQRLWELFLWAALREFSYDVEQLEAPDFSCKSPKVEFTLEATTVAPSIQGALAEHPDPKTPIEIEKFNHDYMAIKFGSALTSKLGKKNAHGLHYWEREESKDRPFVIAIADFHKPSSMSQLGSMTYTQSALWRYLYGLHVKWRIEDDKVVIEEGDVEEHQFNGKKIPSNFFSLPLAENVSAVLFSNAGTIAKFDRMGVVAGFGADGYDYFRCGFRPDSDPNAVIGKAFVDDVRAEDYEEYWTQEIQVFHNPHAKHPLSVEHLMGASHHFIENGKLQSLMPDDAVLSSFTNIVKYTQVSGQ